jgi:hypothetical protein
MHPYSEQPDKSFWKHFNNNRQASLKQLFNPKFSISTSNNIATAGSCFAQHISKALRDVGVSIIDKEPPPFGLNPETARTNHFGIYSARYGNIYTPRHLRQLISEALAGKADTEAWLRADGTFVDALRPQVEQHGFLTQQEMLLHRHAHLAKVKSMFIDMDIFIFTLGLTEAWINTNTGLCFPIAPGVVAGNYNKDHYQYVNFSFSEILSDLEASIEAINQLKRQNGKPDIKVLLTVSPIPLAATASAEHVIHANSYSKSVLRAVAGELTFKSAAIDYFPSYEIVTNPWRDSSAFDNTGRTVSASTIKEVMSLFLNSYGLIIKHTKKIADEDDPLCDEIVLEAITK